MVVGAVPPRSKQIVGLAAFESIGVDPMAMTASSRAPEGAGHQASERSPFARLTELLAPYTPGKPLIALSLGRTAASGSRIRRAGARPAHRRFRPLPDRQGDRAVPESRCRLAIDAVRSAAPDRSRKRSPGPEWQPRGSVFRGADRSPPCRRTQGQAGDPGSKSVLSGLWRRRARRVLRHHLSADHARQRFPARSRRARRRDAGADRGDLHRIARQPARRGREPRLFHPAEAIGRSIRLHDFQRRMLFGNLHPRRAGQCAGMRRSGLHQCRRLSVAVQAIEPAGHAGRLRCRGPQIPDAVS